jgi:hypothetical protein
LSVSTPSRAPGARERTVAIAAKPASGEKLALVAIVIVLLKLMVSAMRERKSKVKISLEFCADEFGNGSCPQ